MDSVGIEGSKTGDKNSVYVSFAVPYKRVCWVYDVKGVGVY